MGNGFAVKGLSIEQKKSQVPVSTGLRGCSLKESRIAIRGSAYKLEPPLSVPSSVEGAAHRRGDKL